MELLAWGNTVMEPHLFLFLRGPAAVNPILTKARNFFTSCVGELHISVAEVEYHLKPGDSFLFESATAHRWFNPGRTRLGCCG